MSAGSVLPLSYPTREDVSLEKGVYTKHAHFVHQDSAVLLPDCSGDGEQMYRVYKRRYFGLIVLLLLNIVVSWAWVVFAPISRSSAVYFDVSEAQVNWLSTGYLLAFCITTPLTFLVLNKRGPPLAMAISAVFTLLGSWAVCAGTKWKEFNLVLCGQLLVGMAQPFVLCTPTSFSNLWFTEEGRTAATAIASLANPLGAAVGQVVGPLLCKSPDQLPRMTLTVSIITSIVCIPAFFVPARPPTPPTASASNNLNVQIPIKENVLRLAKSLEFWLIVLPFWIYVGLFNSFTSLINQIFEPYGHTEEQAGVLGGLLIVVGLLAAALSAPLIDKYKIYLLLVKLVIPLIGCSYAAFIWTVGSGRMIYSYLVASLLGAACFSLAPVLLEYLVEIHHPLGPEVSSSFCWCGGQLLGGIFVIVQTALKAGPHADPPANMHNALLFQAIISLATIPFPMCLGLFGRTAHVRPKRAEVDLALKQHELHNTCDIAGTCAQKV